MPGTIPVPELASWALDLSAKTEKHRITIAKEITVTWTAVRLGTVLMRSMLQSGSTGVSKYERHMRKVNTYCKWCYIQQMKDPASICIKKKKKCHRKIFMPAKIIEKKPVSSPPYVPLNLGLILIQHTLWVFMTNRSTVGKKKRHVHSCLLTVTARCAGRYTCQAAHWHSALSALWQFMISQSFEISSSWHKWWQCTFAHSGYLTCAELMRTHTPYDMTDETYQSYVCKIRLNSVQCSHT